MYRAFNGRDVDTVLSALDPDVHQVVRDRAGAIVADQRVQHVYELRDALVTRMEIRKP